MLMLVATQLQPAPRPGCTAGGIPPLSDAAKGKNLEKNDHERHTERGETGLDSAQPTVTDQKTGHLASRDGN